MQDDLVVTAENISELESTILKEKKELDKKIIKLEEQRKKLKVEQGEAFFCKKCKTVVEKQLCTDYQNERQLCCRCLSQVRQEEERKKILAKLHGARVKNIGFDGYDISNIVVNRDGKSYRLLSETYAENENSFIHICDEWSEEWTGEEIRPGFKERVEKPLPSIK